MFKSIRASLRSSIHLHRPTPWQRGFWIDAVKPGLTLVGVGLVVISVEGHTS